MWTLILQIIGGAVVLAVLAVAIVLILETRFDIIDQQWLQSVVEPIIAPYYNSEISSVIGNIERLYSQTAEEDAKLVCSKLGISISYYGMERVPKDIPLIIINNHQTVFDPCFGVQAINYIRSDQKTKALRVACWPGDNRDTYSLPIVDGNSEGNTLKLSNAKVVLKHLMDGNPLLIAASGRYDSRLFDKSDYFRFKSGFLKFAKAAKVGILPVYIDMHLPLRTRLINSFWPRFSSTFISSAVHLMRNQHIKFTAGNFIPFEDIPKSDLNATGPALSKVLRKYEKLVFNLRKDDKLRAKSTQMDFRKAA